MIFKYINWQQEATKRKITLKEGEALLAKIKAVGQEAKSMTKRLHWLKDYDGRCFYGQKELCICKS
jgi:hypothetical protein